jgi:hypothetical protein
VINVKEMEKERVSWIERWRMNRVGQVEWKRRNGDRRLMA